MSDEEFERLVAASLRHEGLLLPETIEDVRRAEAYLEANPVELPELLKDPMALLEQREKD
jgi:hypothetical protein